MTPHLNQTANELSDTERDGIEAITHSIMELIEPCVRQRCTQWLKLIKENTMPTEGKSQHPLIQYFNFSHLPDNLQKVSQQFHKLAVHIEHNLPDGAEKTVALRKLLESKDCAVRAAMVK